MNTKGMGKKKIIKQLRSDIRHNEALINKLRRENLSDYVELAELLRKGKNGTRSKTHDIQT